MTRVSVCLATYDGAAWVEELLGSVLDQLVRTTRSSSSTTAAATTRSPGSRRCATRGSACPATRPTSAASARSSRAGLARGDLLLLADQDDVWVPGASTAMVAALGSGPSSRRASRCSASRWSPPRWALRTADGPRRAPQRRARPRRGAVVLRLRDGAAPRLLEVLLPFPASCASRTTCGSVWWQRPRARRPPRGALGRPAAARVEPDADRWRSLPTILARPVDARTRARRRRAQGATTASGLSSGGQPTGTPGDLHRRGGRVELARLVDPAGSSTSIALGTVFGSSAQIGLVPPGWQTPNE